jgi:hypothetical protein
MAMSRCSSRRASRSSSWAEQADISGSVGVAPHESALERLAREHQERGDRQRRGLRQHRRRAGRRQLAHSGPRQDKRGGLLRVADDADRPRSGKYLVKSVPRRDQIRRRATTARYPSHFGSYSGYLTPTGLSVSVARVKPAAPASTEPAASSRQCALPRPRRDSRDVRLPAGREAVPRIQVLLAGGRRENGGRVETAGCR